MTDLHTDFDLKKDIKYYNNLLKKDHASRMNDTFNKVSFFLFISGVLIFVYLLVGAE